MCGWVGHVSQERNADHWIDREQTRMWYGTRKLTSLSYLRVFMRELGS